MTDSYFDLTKQNIIAIVLPSILEQGMALLQDQTRAVLDAYPQVYFACHSRHVRDPDTRMRVSQRQVQLLDHLDTTEPSGVTELARHLGVTISTISIGLDRLQRLGYVMRGREALDRRRVAVRLTDAGERIRQAHSVLDPERVSALLANLTVEERERAVDGLQLLAAATRVGRTSHAAAS